MSIDNLPTPMTGSLDDLLNVGDGIDERQFKVFVGHNLGHRVFLLQVPMHEFYKISEVANEQACEGVAVAQRKLDPIHAQKLAKYILKGLVSSAINHREQARKPEIPALSELLTRMGKQPYMSLQPIVTNVRDIGVNGRELRAERVTASSDGTTVGFKVYMSQKNILWVIDGQHRREAMNMVFDFLDNVIKTRVYPKKGSLYDSPILEVSHDELSAWQAAHESARAFSTVSVEMHLGLDPLQERQLFHDLNNLSKKIDKNLALKFDNSNPINLFIKEVLIDELGMNIIEKDVRDWKDDEGGLSLKDAVSINSILFLNKTNISSATPIVVQERIAKAKDFWVSVNAIPGFGETGAKTTTVVAQPVMLKALAKLVYDFNFSVRKPLNGDELSTKLLNAITDIDFSHDNPMWRYYELSESERNKLEGLDDYLPSDDSGNRDLGAYQNGVMRFGAKHNDIFPLLGDIIRWKLSLPNRHTK
ncbi:DNA sulfur modification protein DndB [Pectobacterium versatile]|uniref:DNA sulfur modification protein DndB n=1 Tax=Pectobacterium versatile TaxID=2488639 RepID=UPI00208E2845|nr:DNA sulfur modification protein DndB [Pectobacterium versatile]MCO4311986.1 DNA sulfur modification protein DndB [Pectobacterium versatile]